MTTLTAGPAQAELGRRLEKGVAELGLSLGRDGANKLLQYLALLEKWNQVYNLTAIRDREKVVSGHLLDCLAVIPYLVGTRVLDAGSGAGFPGFPLRWRGPTFRSRCSTAITKKRPFSGRRWRTFS